MDDELPGELVRSDPASGGHGRRRRGRGFSYIGVDGAPLTDPVERARVKALVIPPAWQDVWISPDPAGHIQGSAPTRRAGASTATTTSGAVTATPRSTTGYWRWAVG